MFGTIWQRTDKHSPVVNALVLENLLKNDQMGIDGYTLISVTDLGKVVLKLMQTT